MAVFTLHVSGERKAGEYRHAATARAVAVELAAELSLPVEVCTTDAKGRRKVRTVIQPDGSAKPPSNVERDVREGCVRDEGRACFCTPCRAERKAAR